MKLQHILFMLLLTMGFIACSTAPKRLTTEREIFTGYMLPTSRPSDELLNYLAEQSVMEPHNAVYHRDLGSLYQSRTTLVEPPERWRLVRLANEHLKQAHEKMPEDPQTLIFYGMARASRGKDPEVSIMARMSTVIEGFGLMDRAVSLAPNNFSIRLLRAKANTMAPALMGRGNLLQEDYAWLYPRITGNENLPTHLVALGYIWLGDYYYKQKNEEKAQGYWQQAADLPTAFKQEALDRKDGINIDQ